jgi:hypothetical protein
MGFELGPKLLRRAPRGWLPARAFPEDHGVASHHYGSEGPPEIEGTMHLRATWRVEVPGREPYELREERSAPAWVASASLLGTGNRWYKLRVKPSYGLMKDVGVPCFVNPADPSEIWIDWDAAYKEHEPAWEREARVRREVLRRQGGIDAVLSKLPNPLVGKARPEDERLAAERVAATRAKWAPVPNPALEAGGAEVMRRIQEGQRLAAVGRKTTGVVVSRVESGRTLGLVPVIDLVLDVEGRHLPYEHTLGPRHAKDFTVGRRVEVFVDPDDPDTICPGRALRS